MKYWICFIFCVTGCAQTPVQELSKDALHSLDKSIFEVVIPKKSDRFVRLDKPIPRDQLPFRVRNDKYLSIGTAFVIGPNRMMSAAHVFNLGERSVVEDYFLRDRDGKVYKVGDIFKYAQDRDLIEFSLVEPIVGAVALAFNEKIEVGDTVFTAGNAQGEGISYRNGIVASFTPEPDLGQWNFIRFSAPASPGNSGGPLLDATGRVVGVVARKNNSENLNYAVPIVEYKSLATGTAHFVLKHMALKNGNLSVLRDWDATFPLPQPWKALSEAARASRKQTLASGFDELHGKDMKTFQGPGFAEYLTHQKFVQHLGFLSSDGADRNWRIWEPNASNVELGPNQRAYVASHNANSSVVTIEKPKGMSLEDFVNSPKTAMDAILKATGEAINRGTEHIKYLSYGEPQEKLRWVDPLGRPWLRARWIFESGNYFVDMSCSPVPQGQVCVTFRSTVSVLDQPVEQICADQEDKILLGYRGTLEQWRDYLALRKNELPEIFQGSEIRFKNGELHVKIGANKMTYKDKAITEDDARLYVEAGYTAGGEFPRLQILGMDLVPIEHNFLKMYSVFAPVEDSTHEHKENWKHILAKTGHFDGKPFLQNNYNHIKLVAGEPGSAIAQVVECSRESSESASGLESMCSRFKKGLVVK